MNYDKVKRTQKKIKQTNKKESKKPTRNSSRFRDIELSHKNRTTKISISI